MNERKRYCVFSGSNLGARTEYAKAATELGEQLAAEGIGLVYGGSSVGLMGVIADAVLKSGGEVIGVIPQFMVGKEVAHQGLSDLHITTSMHERKALMAELSDGFIALPGGIGTFEETFEIWTWAKLGHHTKPCGLLNCEGFYDGLASFLDMVVREGFLGEVDRQMLLNEREPWSLLKAMKRYVAPAPRGRWMPTRQSAE
ncbi:MAG TPA: TIGR00730 family Rossman fold protein [Candidatus Saccharimonadales bacterium]|nr:TIGR00730 family Rossman fold protein [Candidatus Saccharimonadales bacterium]